jgi:hypothetical protein
MTRKDYVLIAQTLAQFTGDSGDVIDRDAIAQKLADALATDNPRFDRFRFLVACGVYEQGRKDILASLGIKEAN